MKGVHGLGMKNLYIDKCKSANKNGNETETGYILCASGEEAIENYGEDFRVRNDAFNKSAIFFR